LISLQIVDALRSNRISTTQVCDALGKKGAIQGVVPITPGMYAVGPVHYVFANSGSNASLHEQIQAVPPGFIIFVDAVDCGDQAVFGDIVAKYLHLYKGAVAIVTNGNVRDAHSLLRSRVPVWSIGRTPIGCVNERIKPNKSQLEQIAQNKNVFSNSILVCDDSGVALIEERQVTSSFLDKLEAIELQEDIWYFCIDTLKWSTYETIVQKRYLAEPGSLPAILRHRMSALDSL